MKRVLAGVAIITVLCSTSGFSQIIGQPLPIPDSIPVGFAIPGQLNFTGAGARAAGMGGAYLGVSDDVSAVSWNPAGLSKFESPVFGVSLGSFAPRGETFFENSISKQTPSFSDLGLLSFIAPVRIKGHHFVASLSVSRVDNEFSSAFSRDSLPFDSDGDGSTFSPTTATFTSSASFQSGLQAINFGFGTVIKENLSFGGAINIYNGKAETKNNTDINLPNVQFLQIDPTGLQEIDIVGSQFTLDSTKYSGINFTVGFKYDRPKFSAGIIARTPYSLELEVDRRNVRLLFAEGLAVNTDTVLFDNNVIQIDIPFMIGGGFAFRPTKNVTLAVDAEYRAFAGQKGRFRDTLVLVPGSNSVERFVEFDPLFNNVFTVRTGGEYKWNTGSAIFPTVPLRAGFAFIPVPSPDLALNPSGTAIVTSKASEISFSVGSGIQWEQIHLDVAYIRTTFDRDLLVGTALGKVLPSRLDGKNNQFKFTFTGYF